MESTLSLQYSDIQSAVGYQLGYGRTSTAWSTNQAADVADVIKRGERQFYGAYDWRFLKPTTTITTVANQQAYDLPDDFGTLIDGPVFTSDFAYSGLEVIGEGQVRAMDHLNRGSGVPQVAAVRWKASDGVLGQRAEMLFWPTPDSAYTLTYKYGVLPRAMDSDHPYPLGGLQHAETIMESCLAIAEQAIDGAPGVHTAKYERCLQESATKDRRGAPHTLGMMGEGRRPALDEIVRNRWTRVTYNGVGY